MEGRSGPFQRGAFQTFFQALGFKSQQLSDDCSLSRLLNRSTPCLDVDQVGEFLELDYLQVKFFFLSSL